MTRCPLLVPVVTCASGCIFLFAEPCPTEGELQILVTDADGASVCPDSVQVIDPDGTELPADCDCGDCYVDTLVEGTHEVTVTVGEEVLTDTADLWVYERCATPRATVEFVVP